MHVAVQPQPIEIGEVLRHVEGAAEGGVAVFLGRVRNHARGRTVLKLDYEAYVPMAEAELARLADEARRRFAVGSVAAVHRTGTLAIGEVAVAIAVSAGHRPAAFDACRWLIDELKRSVPIWKREWYGDGSQWIAEHP